MMYSYIYFNFLLSEKLYKYQNRIYILYIKYTLQVTGHSIARMLIKKYIQLLKYMIIYEVFFKWVSVLSTGYESLVLSPDWLPMIRKLIICKKK